MTGNALQIIAWLGQYVGKATRFTIREEKAKRSLNANGYYWSLVGQIAKSARVSSSLVHNRNLRALGYVERIGGKLVTVTLPDTDEAEQAVIEADTYHLKPTSQVRIGNDGKAYRTYVMLRGSHGYNTEEFSALLDIVIQDAEALGIETITPAAKREMMERYGLQIQKKQGNGHQ